MVHTGVLRYAITIFPRSRETRPRLQFANYPWPQFTLIKFIPVATVWLHLWATQSFCILVETSHTNLFNQGGYVCGSRWKESWGDEITKSYSEMIRSLGGSAEFSCKAETARGWINVIGSLQINYFGESLSWSLLLTKSQTHSRSLSLQQIFSVNTILNS